MPRFFAAFALLLTPLCAQTAPKTAPQGVPPDWDIRVILQELSAQASRLLPLLDRIDMKAWVAKGASETYAAQLESTRAQVNSVAIGAKELATRPEKLSAALEIFFRMQGVDSMVRSLEAGVRKYQDAALADSIAATARENGRNRERFQRYIIDMAVQREQEYAVMDHEAQRCRGMLAQQPNTPPKTSGRKR